MANNANDHIHIRTYKEGLLSLVLSKEINSTEFTIGTIIANHCYPNDDLACLVPNWSWSKWTTLMPFSKNTIIAGFKKLCDVGILYKLETDAHSPTGYVKFKFPTDKMDMRPIVDDVLAGKRVYHDTANDKYKRSEPKKNVKKFTAWERNGNQNIPKEMQDILDRNMTGI